MYDYEIQYIERKRREEFNSTENWIYIGIDTDRPTMFKVGLTTHKLSSRHSSSQNPFYTLLVAFKVKIGISGTKVKEIETAVLREISKFYQPINHYNSGNRSEWFYGDPLQARDFVNDFLYENYSYEMNCYYCHIRQRGIVYGWENERYLYLKKKTPYKVSDITTQPEDPDCYNYGGCGDENCESCSSNWYLKSR
ncbi:hypothetical protein BFR77_00160 [Acinetobacter pittii]|uniref:GIY-YIG nuclease family protein n=1 Tax=Acinetobacter pittii TaxID=48296 RepID=UPI0008391F54|nr:GIY-YIG nuclease family protein [Acinetobacter pittii]OCY47540.1 hypothetical protein BFR77_00160 [Acinetobacter pittii]